MRSDSELSGQPDRTFIEAARRAQIVTAAIDTIAEFGYGQASLAKIAERAGTSKGVISYHFAGKDDLIREVVADVLARAEAHMIPRILAESSGAAMLRAYITSNLEFMREHRNHLVAFLEIFLNARGEAGRRLLDERSLDHTVTSLQQLLAHFQAVGDLRPDFDPLVMAIAIRGAIDQIPPRLARDSGLDVDRYANELAALFDLATRPGSPPDGTTARARP
jgi:TetR/AcrR family transcriptional regulator, fatty acid metabolism regulator protein